jgi:UDP-N-acetylmuramate dehydrogenase
MIVREHVPLAPLTTLGVGGAARFLIEGLINNDLDATISLSKEEQLPLFVIGEGSNILIPDEGIHGIVLHPIRGEIEISKKEHHLEVRADASVPWDTVVQ